MRKKQRGCIDVAQLITNALKKKPQVKASDIVKATGFSRAYVNRFFQQLKQEGKIVLLGNANTARYILADQKIILRTKRGIMTFRRMLRNINLSEDIVLDEIVKNTGIFAGISENVSRILSYAFTEMLNNAIEHSGSRSIEVFMEKSGNAVCFKVFDKGVGIFHSIMQKMKFRDQMEAINELLKGKLSTMPASHSGEGIFFTSRLADTLVIQSAKKKLIFDNTIKDTFNRDGADVKGTKVVFSIGLDSGRNTEDVFRQYAGNSFKFDKTEVRVKLYHDGVQYLSRSQARRIVSGLEKFKTIQLDFDNVETIGQGFADEIFRVWKARFPHINVVAVNTNQNIQFMINRAVPTQ